VKRYACYVSGDPDMMLQTECTFDDVVCDVSCMIWWFGSWLPVFAAGVYCRYRVR